MRRSGYFALLLHATGTTVCASPQVQVSLSGGNGRFFDVQVLEAFIQHLRIIFNGRVQAHRGGRGNTIENTLPAFAQYVE